MSKLRYSNCKRSFLRVYWRLAGSIGNALSLVPGPPLADRRNPVLERLDIVRRLGHNGTCRGRLIMARKDATVFRQRRQGMTAKCPFRPAAVALHCALEQQDLYFGIHKRIPGPSYHARWVKQLGSSMYARRPSFLSDN